MKIERFEQLTVWQESINFSASVYIATKKFPEEEKFGLISQLKRASSSISANIAEGFGRRTKKDKLHFYTIAYGSLLETRSFIYLSIKLGYVPKDTGLLEESQKLQMLLNGFLKSTRNMNEQ